MHRIGLLLLFTRAQNSGTLQTFKRRDKTTMANGTVKWFNATKGYGFIQPSDGTKDIFVHISAVEKAGLNNLREGQAVQYELATQNGKSSAVNLKVS